MSFNWDDDKSSACCRLRDFDFAYAAFAFADPDRIICQDQRLSHDEDRYELTGRVEDCLYVLIDTPRLDGIRIISARKANPPEVKRHENCSNED